LLYQALGFEIPQFAHLPMIMGPDGSRLSKRHGATSLTEYMGAGYLPEAMLNYFALLGWSTQDSQQLFKQDELIRKFSLEKCSKSSAMFDPQKLLWMNGEYIRSLSAEDLFRRSIPYLEKENLCHDGDDTARIQKAIALEQDKIKQLEDVPRLIKFLVTDEVEYEKDAVELWMSSDESLRLLSEIKNVLENLSDFSFKNIEETVRSFAKKKGIKTSQIFHPLRVAISGRTKGPSLFEMLAFLGKKRVIDRLSKAVPETAAKKKDTPDISNQPDQPDTSKKSVDPYFHNLLLSLYNSARRKQEEISALRCPTYQQKERASMPRKIMEMLLLKMEPTLTEDEKKLFLNLLKDAGSDLKEVMEHANISLQDQKLPPLTSHLFEGEIKIYVNKSVLSILTGDLIQMPVEAIISPDNTKLFMDRGVSSIVRLWGGERIREEAQKIIGKNAAVGSVVVTEAGELSCKYILHALIMEPRKETTRDNIRQALNGVFKKVTELGIKSIAFPAFGTATVKFPYDTCAKVMLESIIENMQKTDNLPLETVYLTLYNREAYGCFIQQFNLLNEVYGLKVERDAL